MPGLKPTLLLLYPDCITFEVMLTLELLHHHTELTVASPDGAEVTDSSGLLVHPQQSYDEVKPEHFGLVLVPGGDPRAIMNDARVDKILQIADAQDTPIGGISAGVLVLAKSGILQGRYVVHSYRTPFASEEVEAFTAPYWEGARVLPEPERTVVRDGNVVTALANGFVDFALEITQLLGIHTLERATLLGRHFRGAFIPGLYGRA